MATYLVTGATGQQGGAVVTHLLSAGLKVHAVVRNPSSPASTALKEKGVTLFEGTHESPDEPFRTAAKGCTGVFLNLSVFEPGTARKQADAVINAIKAGGGSTLTSIVLSSTSRTDEMSSDPAIPAKAHPWLGQYYTAKSEVEAAVRESGIESYTILRPPVLNHDYLLPASATDHTFPELPREGLLVSSLKEGLTMPYLDPDDIGKFTVAAFQNPAKFNGHGFDLAGDNLTPEQARDVLAGVSGVEITFHRRTDREMEEAMATRFFQAFERLSNNVPCSVDIKAVEEKYGLKMVTFKEYMEKNKEKLLDSLPPRSAKFL